MAELPLDLETVKSNILCKEHKNQVCSFLCLECEETICEDCIDDHSGHQVKTAKKLLNDDNIAIEDWLKFDVNNFKQRLMDGISNKFTKQVSKIETQASALKSAIDSMKAKKVKECDKMLKTDLKTINECLPFAKLAELQSFINDLPEMESKTRYAILAFYYFKVGHELEEKVDAIYKESITDPGFTEDPIQQDVLEGLFGDLVLSKDEDLEDYIKCIYKKIKEDEEENSSSDDEDNSSPNDEGLPDFVEDSDKK